MKTSKALPHCAHCRTSKGAIFLLPFLLSRGCCTPPALSQQTACRGHEGTNVSPSFPLSNTGVAVNGVTGVRLEMLTDVGEVVFTNRIQEITWKGGENKAGTGSMPWCKPAMGHPQSHAAAPALGGGSKKSIIELGQLQRKEIQREEANIIRASKQGTRMQAGLLSPKKRHPGRCARALYSLGGWGRARGAFRAAPQARPGR